LRNGTATLILVVVGSRSRAVDPDPVRRLVSERAQWGRRSSSELLPQPTLFRRLRTRERGFFGLDENP
jgi:hypothetical protein